MTKMTKMNPVPTYRILELQTTGWEELEEATNLTKEQCDQKLKEYAIKAKAAVEK